MGISFLLSFLLLILGGICIVIRKYAIGLFNILWAVVFFICRKEFTMEQYNHTLLLLVLMVMMTNAGYFLGNRKRKMQIAEAGNRRKYACQEKNLMWLLVIACIVFVWYAIRTLWLFGFDLVEIRAHNNVNNENSAFQSVVDTVLFYGVATPLIYTAILTFAYNFSQDVKTQPKLYGLAFAAILLQMITTGGGRSIILRGVLFFAAAIIMRFSSGKAMSKVKMLAVAGIGVAMLLILELATYIRNDGEISFVGQAVDYVRGAVGHMQYRLTRPMGPQYYGGFVTFGGFLYYPIKLFNALTGLDFQTSNELLAYLQEYRSVQLYDQTINYNALVPNAFYFFFDNGYVGVVLFSAGQGYLMQRAEENSTNPSFLGFVLWATCIYMIVYSPLDGVLWTFRHPTTILCCIILNKHLYRPVCDD